MPDRSLRYDGHPIRALLPMTTYPTDVSLPQTLGLLDCLDAVQARKQGRPSPAELAEHLQTVCQTMGQPIDSSEAEQAVILHLGDTEVAAPSCLGERPANAKEWQQQLTQLDAEIKDIERRLKRAERQATWNSWILRGCTVWALFGGLTCGLAKVLTGLKPGGALDHTHSGLWALVCLGVSMAAWGLECLREARDPSRALNWALSDAKERRHQLTEIPVAKRPDVVTLKAWCDIPGLKAAFYRIHTSSVPMLRQDVRAMKQMVEKFKDDAEKNEKERVRLQQEQAWQQTFQQLGLDQVEPRPS